MGICWGVLIEVALDGHLLGGVDRGSARWTFAGGLIEVALDGHLLGGVDRGSARWAFAGGC